MYRATSTHRGAPVQRRRREAPKPPAVRLDRGRVVAGNSRTHDEGREREEAPITKVALEVAGRRSAAADQPRHVGPPELRVEAAPIVRVRHQSREVGEVIRTVADRRELPVVDHDLARRVLDHHVLGPEVAVEQGPGRRCQGLGHRRVRARRGEGVEETDRGGARGLAAVRQELRERVASLASDRFPAVSEELLDRGCECQRDWHDRQGPAHNLAARVVVEGAREAAVEAAERPDSLERVLTIRDGERPAARRPQVLEHEDVLAGERVVARAVAPRASYARDRRERRVPVHLSRVPLLDRGHGPRRGRRRRALDDQTLAAERDARDGPVLAALFVQRDLYDDSSARVKTLAACADPLAGQRRGRRRRRAQIPCQSLQRVREPPSYVEQNHSRGQSAPC